MIGISVAIFEWSGHSPRHPPPIPAEIRSPRSGRRRGRDDRAGQANRWACTRRARRCRARRPRAAARATGAASPVSAQQPLDRRGVALGERPRLGVRARDLRREAARRARPRAPRRPRRPSAPSSACTRLTTRPPNGIPARRACRGRRSPPRPARARASVTMRNVVAGSPSSASTPSRALLEAVDQPAERAEEHATGRRAGRRRSAAAARRTRRSCPRPTTFAASPVGARNTLSARPSKKPVSRSGASRKSSALRDGGVSSTSTSKRPERSSS